MLTFRAKREGGGENGIPRPGKGLKKLRAVGLMSGTSADGIDAALVEFRENPLSMKLLEFSVYPYPPDLRSRILRAFSPITPLVDLGELNMVLGRVFGEAALKLLKKSKISPDTVDFIGSHGQTVHHQPPSRLPAGGTAFTLQLGEGSVIAEKTGVLTVSDFRAADMAAGGEGAPLVAYFDWRFFTHPEKNRVLLNIGGIANITVLPARGKLSEITAMDTGPGNALLDSLVSLFTGGKENFDNRGSTAARGIPREDLLREFFALPFFSRPFPKSAARAEFGIPLAEQILRAYGNVPPVDVLATATAFTAESIARALLKHASQADEIYVSGGGIRNKTLMSFLKRLVDQRYARAVAFLSFDLLGIPAKAKEAAAFAFFARETLKGVPSNVPQVTGAAQARILGKISQGWRKFCVLV